MKKVTVNTLFAVLFLVLTFNSYSQNRRNLQAKKFGREIVAPSQQLTPMEE